MAKAFDVSTSFGWPIPGLARFGVQPVVAHPGGPCARCKRVVPERVTSGEGVAPLYCGPCLAAFEDVADEIYRFHLEEEQDKEPTPRIATWMERTRNPKWYRSRGGE